jgi:hypothetical protein
LGVVLTSERLLFTQIDREFAEDESGLRLDAVRRRLAAGRERCRAALETGVAPDEAGRLSRLIAAYGTALDIVPFLWEAQRRRR